MSDCAESTTVSNQADVDNLSSECYYNVVIQGEMDTLDFATLAETSTITARDSQWLEMLFFPHLSTLGALIITNMSALTTVSLPMLSPGWLGYETHDVYFQNGSLLNLNVSTAPNLITLELENLKSYGNLSLFTTAPDDRISDIGTSNMSTAVLVETDACIDFSSLQDVGELQIFAVLGCDYSFFSLRSAGDITLSNANTFNSIAFESGDPIRINNSLILESSARPDPVFSDGSMPFDRISTIGHELRISSMSNTHTNFDGLTGVGGDLLLVGNTNCAWDFSQVTSAGSLTVLDNEDTVILLFSKLQTVENIHLRGNIDTSGGPNIFPTLVLARGNVTIEAWNSNFNCSKLVSQWNDGVIHNLSCNGTGGTVGIEETGTSAPNPANTSTADPSDSARLSTAALASISVGSGSFVLLVIAIVIWLILHYRRQLLSLERQTLPFDHLGHDQLPGHPDVGGIHEVDGTGIIREKPHDPIIPELSDSRPELSTSSMPGSPVKGTDQPQHLALDD